MTARDEELAPLIRGVFLPEEGEIWAEPDVSQQEFRLIVHYAAVHGLPKAKEAVERYRSDPDTDFHLMVADLTGLDRDLAKPVNFAKAFGAGERKFAAMIGKPVSEARAIYHRYDRELPFVSGLSALCRAAAARHGYLQLYDGARRHFDSWEAVGVPWGKGTGPCSREEAERRTADPDHPWYRHRLRRAETHKAMNALIQGSAARHTKLWMRACWREGIVPLLQMHDSLDCSVTSPEQAERVAQLGREAVTLGVPIRVDLKFGANWGDAKHSWEELGKAAQLKQETRAAPKPQPTRVNGFDAHPKAADDITVPPQATESTLPPLAAVIGQHLIADKICCPFHDDDTPSLHVYTDHFYCFGCGKHGDHVTWLTEVEGFSHQDRRHTGSAVSGQPADRCPGTAKQSRSGAALPPALSLWFGGTTSSPVGAVS
jgi:DNA polymerase family A/CHC2 zinc finger